MAPVRVGVHEVNTRGVGIPVKHNELDNILIEGERIECFPVGNGYCAVAELDRGGGVHRVHTHRVREFGDVVDAISVNVAGVGDEVLLHPVTLCWQCLHTLRERGRARFPLLHQDRNFHLSSAFHQNVLHIKNEIIIRSGRDLDRNSTDGHFYGCRVIAAA